MTDRIVRIKSSRQGYRRGGLEFGSNWVEVDTSTLTRDQQRAILADGVLAIEGREDDGSWTTLTDEIRGGLLSLVQAAPGYEVEGEERALEVDPGILAKANDWDALLAVISLHQADLEGLKLWPFETVDGLVVALINGLGEAEAVIADRDASILSLSGPTPAELAELVKPYAAALHEAGIVLKERLQDVIPQLLTEMLRFRQQWEELASGTNPSDVQQDGGEASTTAAPGPGGAAQVGATAGAENGGEGGQPDAGSETVTEPEPKPKPAKAKGAASKPT